MQFHNKHMGRTLRNPSWNILETLFHPRDNGEDHIKIEFWKVVENQFWKIFDNHFCSKCYEKHSVFLCFLKYRSKSRIFYSISYYKFAFIRKIARKIFEEFFRPLFKIRFLYGLHRCHEGEKVFIECSTRDFATYIPYAYSEIACRVKSLRWCFNDISYVLGQPDF